MNMVVGKLQKNIENDIFVEADSVVRLRFRVSDADSGEALQYGDDLYYLHGGYGGAFPKVEQKIEGGRVGDRHSLRLYPHEGYGERQPELVLTLPSSEFADTMPTTGEAVEGELPDGRSMTFTVAEVAAGSVTLDGNHPFCGRTLDFELEILEVRDSIEAERTAGFAFDGMFC